MLSGASTWFPLVLSHTAIAVLTICMYCVAPTSPFVSGGAQLQFTPGNEMPSKLRFVPGIFGAARLLCTTGSFRFLWSCTICGLGCAGWFGPGFAGFGVMSFSFGDLSFFTEWPTVTLPLPFPLPLLSCSAAAATPFATAGETD